MTDRPELERWNSRFAAKEFVFGEKPNEFLNRHMPQGPGRALCVADGEGRNGVWLARHGWDVLSLDFSPVAQVKAADLAARHGVSLQIVEADVHVWPYLQGEFDLVADIFSQFSNPDQRAQKWAGMMRALRPGGLLMVVGYTPDQLKHRTGGPSQVENLYTESLLRDAFGGLQIEALEVYETELTEGAGHAGRSAVAGLIARKPA